MDRFTGPPRRKRATGTVTTHVGHAPSFECNIGIFSFLGMNQSRPCDDWKMVGDTDYILQRIA